MPHATTTIESVEQAESLLAGLTRRMATSDVQRRAVWAMSPAQRLAAYRRGELTLVQLRAWQQYHLAELPATSITGQGELPWILAYTEDYLGDDF